MDSEVHDRSFDDSNGGSVSGDDSKDISELVKVEINNSTDDISADENNEQNEHINSNLRLVTISILTIDNGIWMILESSRDNPVST